MLIQDQDSSKIHTIIYHVYLTVALTITNVKQLQRNIENITVKHSEYSDKHKLPAQKLTNSNFFNIAIFSLPSNKPHKTPKSLFLYLEIEFLCRKIHCEEKTSSGKKCKHKNEKLKRQQGYPISQQTRNTCPEYLMLLYN